MIDDRHGRVDFGSAPAQTEPPARSDVVTVEQAVAERRTVAALDEAIRKIAAAVGADANDPLGVAYAVQETMREADRVHARNRVLEADRREIVAIAEGKRRTR